LKNPLNSENINISIMTEVHISTPNKGLPIGTKAPMIDTEDIDGDNINLTELLKKHKGILLDLFRGSW
jgi:hypothetical protein